MGTDSKGPILILTERKWLQDMEDLAKCQVVGTLQNVDTQHIKIFDPSRYRVRKLTPTEYGRLQAFPMGQWKQVVSDSQAYKQFGNAVTVSLFYAIAKQIAKAIFEAEERSTREIPEDMGD